MQHQRKIFIKIYMLVMLLSCPAVQCNIVVMPEAVYSYTSPTAKVDNYILQHQRQFEHQILALEKYLQDFRKQFHLSLNVIEYYDAVVDKKLRDFKDKLDPLEMMGDATDVCVEKYRSRMPADKVLQDNLKACINKAKIAVASLTSNPENTLKSMRSQYNNHFTNAIKDCKKKFDVDEMKYKNCAAAAIKSMIAYLDTNTNTFHALMNTAECGSNTKIDEAFDCYSLIVYETFTIMGEVNGLIENCLAGHDFYSACDIDYNYITRGRCPYQLAWHFTDDDRKSDKIVNPFRGINSTAPCLQINFIRQTLINNLKKE